MLRQCFFFFFFFNDTATTEIYTLSLHDALPIWVIGWCDRASRSRSRSGRRRYACPSSPRRRNGAAGACQHPRDRKSTRLNSSHSQISYAVFCLKKKKKKHDGTVHEDLMNRAPVV